MANQANQTRSRPRSNLGMKGHAVGSWSHCSGVSISLHCALSLAGQCNVIGPVCVFVGLWVVGVFVYFDKSKLHAFTKLGL